MTVFEELKWRGLIKDISSPELEEKLNKGGLSFYIGTDPTADSLHVGHLSSFLISKRLKEAGHHPYLLVGGATGMIGEPRPTKERAMISKEQVSKNIAGLTKQVKELFGFDVVNNYEWTKDINVLDFLRDYGKYFNINYMLNKDIIRRRLESGITYTEFSYMLLQALDFKYLHEHKGVDMQCAGSDQWGNITAGIDLIRKSTGDEVYGFTMPLVTDSQGNKFGKSEGNALWLDKNKTSSYEIYQFLINAEDEKVIDYCFIHGETDLKKGFLSFPITLEPRKNHFFVETAVDYAFSAGLDEVSIMTKDQTLKPVLEKLGFISLGIDGDVASYTLGLEDKEKGKIRI